MKVPLVRLREHTVLAADFAYFAGGLDYSRFVIGGRYGAKKGVPAHCALYFRRLNPAVFIGVYERYFKAVRKHILCTFN